ncbi:rhodanese-like domain-containing protein [Paenibacillus radicis (ex Xue et al. 2023)]|uniref:Rhodanese-like domain-containing protein n=1 Tax=Paenibacillus radicis (ex Xue et al. 2023) TaxID=2972489 RepID=A0ABT1YU05_9BACL|nr:rhodanese-like domain-containing protein [Paenibacillus radicis (ex Xue et al. 2023)]MCR8636668.1 rhodanese-like domain-containing protein [Paenibacillus radicis (ex Xue et al. 2023)]
MAQIIEGISHLDSHELKNILDQTDNPVIVIDVREPEEYEAAHISELPLIPMGDIIDVIDRLDKNKEYVFVCRSGRRSFEVAKYFSTNGFERVHNHLGGMLDWQQQGHDIAVGPSDLVIESLNPEQLERKNNR